MVRREGSGFHMLKMRRVVVDQRRKLQGVRQSCVQISLLTLGCVAVGKDITSPCLSFLIWTMGCYEDVVGSLQDNPSVSQLPVVASLCGALPHYPRTGL